MSNRVQDGMVFSYQSHDNSDHILGFYPTSQCKGDYQMQVEIGRKGRIDIVVIDSPHDWLTWRNLYDIARRKLSNTLRAQAARGKE